MNGVASAASATESDELTADTLPSSDAHSKNAKDVKQNQFKFNQGQGKKGVDNIVWSDHTKLAISN